MSEPPLMQPPPPLPMYPPVLHPLKRQFPLRPTPYLPPPPHFPHLPDLSAAGAFPGPMKPPDGFPPKGIYETRHENIMIGWPHGSRDVSGNFSPRNVPSPAAKRSNKAKAAKLGKSGSCFPGSNDEGLEVPSVGATSASSCRYDSSLGFLTKKFINLIQQEGDGSLDLKEAAKILAVQKRRIYDITNVLEGIGLIEKSLKNKITWKGLDILRPTRLDLEVSEIKTDLENMYAEDIRLDERIREMQEHLIGLTEDENYKRWLYVTNEDITKLPCFQDETLIAIKAPHGAMLEVPHPVDVSAFQQEQYELLLRSVTGPINCYLISGFVDSNAEEGVGGMNQDLRTEGAAELAGEGNNIDKNDTETCRTRGEDDHALQGSTRCSSSSRSSVGALTKIVSSEADDDTDYWLLTDDGGGSITKIWNT